MLHCSSNVAFARNLLAARVSLSHAVCAFAAFMQLSSRSLSRGAYESSPTRRATTLQHRSVCASCPPCLAVFDPFSPMSLPVMLRCTSSCNATAPSQACGGIFQGTAKREEGGRDWKHHCGSNTDDFACAFDAPPVCSVSPLLAYACAPASHRHHLTLPRPCRRLLAACAPSDQGGVRIHRSHDDDQQISVRCVIARPLRIRPLFPSPRFEHGIGCRAFGDAPMASASQARS